MVVPSRVINPHGDIEETNVIIQEELTEISKNELKVQFKNGYQPKTLFKASGLYPE
nr:unnamed protein product [Callosobruchus analis]